MPDLTFHEDLPGDYAEYLRDESRRVGDAVSISFPGSELELRAQLQEARRLSRRVTIQGARTGITGGAVPAGGHVLNLSRMDRVLGLRRMPDSSWRLRVQPGLPLSTLRDALSGKVFPGEEALPPEEVAAFRADGAWSFPPDPTETSAAIGGMAACNASGAQSFAYGPTRGHISAARVVLANGQVLVLTRDDGPRAIGREFSAQSEAGDTYTGTLPGYAMPAVKNAAGYYVADDMSLLDLFIGSEGTLGVFSEIEIQLSRAPASRWGLTAFLPSEEAACDFVEAVRNSTPRPVSIEYFDDRALAMLHRQKASREAFSALPDIPDEPGAAVYVEIHAQDEDAAADAVATWGEMLALCGGDEDATWLACDARELQRLADFRHAVPESVNLHIDECRRVEPRLTKLGTDLSVPDDSLRDVLRMYREDLEAQGLDFVRFGHIGDNHVHVNIIPRDLDEYEQGKALYLRWAREVVRRGGSVSAEHGIGKLKTAMLREMYGEPGIAAMLAIKAVFDPDRILSPGNLFADEAE